MLHHGQKSTSRIFLHNGFSLGNVIAYAGYGVIGGYGALAVLDSRDGDTWGGVELRFDALGSDMSDEVIDATLPSISFVLLSH